MTAVQRVLHWWKRTRYGFSEWVCEEPGESKVACAAFPALVRKGIDALCCVLSPIVSDRPIRNVTAVSI